MRRRKFKTPRRRPKAVKRRRLRDPQGGQEKRKMAKKRIEPVRGHGSKRQMR